VFQLTALYSHPEDPAAFDKHYREVHAVLASKIPGLRKYTMSWPGPGPDGAPPQYYLVAVLYWDSESEGHAALGSPESEAAVADLANFAGAGVDILLGTAEAVV
jgi:uncharacterized protein (TIGR02118 family)